MRRLFHAALVAASTLALAQIASAADLPVKAPVYKAPIIAPVYNWTGFYVGLNLGGSWGRQDGDLIGALIGSGSNNLDGLIGGGQIGYNWQINQWVFGLEADFQGSGQKADGSFVIPPIVGIAGGNGLTASYSDKLEWFGTVRGRVGYAFDRWLPYFTGGWAYGHGVLDGTATVTPAGAATAFSASHDYSGWTIGGGVEWAFANNWSAKLEYLYIDFGDGPTVPVSATSSIVAGKMTDNIIRAGVNYKF